MPAYFPHLDLFSHNLLLQRTAEYVYASEHVWRANLRKIITHVFTIILFYHTSGGARYPGGYIIKAFAGFGGNPEDVYFRFDGLDAFVENVEVKVKK